MVTAISALTIHPVLAAALTIFPICLAIASASTSASILHTLDLIEGRIERTDTC